MKLDEAIKNIETAIGLGYCASQPQFREAIQLGIEALELKQKLYDLYMNSIKWTEPASKLIKAPLPSETEGGSIDKLVSHLEVHSALKNIHKEET